MQHWLACILVTLFAFSGCQSRQAGQVAEGDTDEPPRWHFDRIPHAMSTATLTDVWGRDDGSVFIVGWYGTIFTNRRTERNPDGLWRPMESNTTEHLTAIWGLRNGRRFDQAPRDGQMFAVGWNGTLLHYHPNPAGLTDPEPEDGAWQVIAGPGQGFVPRLKIDPFCPDYDGDGIPDDGGGDPVTPGPDGWWSRADTCTGGADTNCDDNCRTSPNGPQRPIVDLNGDFGTGPANNCLLWGEDGGEVANSQTDPDGDGIGTVCDDSATAPIIDGFSPTLFDVWATVDPDNDSRINVVAVGENGAVVSYVGPDAAETVVAPDLPVGDRMAWIAQEELPYWYATDCAVTGGAVVDGACSTSGRVAPRCPAQCNVYKTDCECPPAQNQCCVDAGNGPELVGVSCVEPRDGPSCGTRAGLPADNGCDGATGRCNDGCIDCFRRLTKTLRAVVSDGNQVLAVGASGTIVSRGLNDPGGVWVQTDCGGDTPEPMDERPILTAVSTQEAGSFEAVGAGGVVVVINPASGCGLGPRCGAPPAFLSGVFSLGPGRAFAAGDAGTLVWLNADSGDCSLNPPVTELDNDIPENFNAIWVTGSGNMQRLWLVGASGALVRAGFF